MTRARIAAPQRYDVLSTGVDRDPVEVHAGLHESPGPVRGGPATWVVSHHDQVAALLRDPRLGHPEPVGEDPTARLPEEYRPGRELPRLISGLDAGDHLRVRRLMAGVLTPRRLAGLEPWISSLVRELVAGLVPAGRTSTFDAVEDLALPLQTAVACELLGVPADDRPEVCRHAMALGRAIILVPFVTPERGNGDPEARWLREYTGRLAAERARRPGTDLISEMLRVRQHGDALTVDEVADNAVFLLFAGFETVMAVVAGGLAALVEHPDQLARLRAHPELTASAVEETLRWETPLQWVSRTLIEDVEVGGRRLRAGRIVLLLLAAANRDPGRFEEPHTFDVGRHPNPHLSFGAGVHRCLGVALARLEGATALAGVLEAAEVLEAAGPAERNRHPNIRSHARVPLRARGR